MLRTSQAVPSFVAEQEYCPIGQGKKAVCQLYSGPGLVIKTEKQVFDGGAAAYEHAIELKRQYDFLSTSIIGKYVEPSLFVASRDDIGYRVSCIQKYQRGISIARAVVEARRKNLDISGIVDMYSKSIFLLHHEGVMPDLTARPSLIGWFRPNHTPNVLVSEIEGAMVPRLIDVGFITGGVVEMALHPDLLAYSVAESVSRMILLHSDRVNRSAQYIGVQALRLAS